ncbi:MAG: hypothetical protein AAGA73_21520 [Pseudomonadota bacterium]
MAKSVTRWWTLIVAMILGMFSKGGLAQNVSDSDYDRFKSELQAFEQARAKNTEAAYRDFLRRFPEGQLTDEAFRDLVSTLVKQERPLFEPAFDQQLVIEGLMPAPVEPTLTATSEPDSQQPSSQPTLAARPSVTPSTTAPASTERTYNRRTVASQLDPY